MTENNKTNPLFAIQNENEPDIVSKSLCIVLNIYCQYKPCKLPRFLVTFCCKNIFKSVKFSYTPFYF